MRLPCAACGRVEPKTCSRADCPYFVHRPRTFKQEFSGSAPNIFVGRFGYPDVRVGILATEEYADNDDPKGWSKAQTPIPEILEKRGSLVNSQFLANVRSFRDRFLQDAQLVAQGKNPTDMEVRLDRVPTFSIQYPPGTSPHGASVKLVQSRLTENVRIPKAVDKAVSDNDLKAASAITELYGKIDEHYLTRLLTGGVLGQKSQRRLVPTRWSITAVDDTLGKRLLERVKELPVLGEPLAFFGGHYGNHYCIILLPRNWQYELFEFAVSGQSETRVWTDHETYSGRTNYADDTGGGYYAARLPILEKLESLGRQATVLCLRFVTGEYTNPLGVWVVREAVRKALETKPLRFSDESLALTYAKARCTRFSVDWQHEVQDKSFLLKSLKQKRLSDY